MQNKFNNLLHRQLTKKNFANDEQKQLYLMQLFSTICAATIHVVAICFFIYANITPLILYNVISICIYAIMLVLVERGKNLAVGILLPIEVMLYVIYSVYMLGSGHMIIMYLVLTMMLQVVMPYTKKAGSRYFIVALLWGAAILLTMAENATPLVLLRGTLGDTYRMLNVQVGIVGVIALLILKNMISRVVSAFNQEELEKFRTEANVDPLTGLFNRRYARVLFDKLKAERPTGSDGCIAMMDIDNFKSINDKYGHNSGDRVLIAVSNTISNHLRKTDLVFRWGGEEFLVVLRDVASESAYQILEKLRQKIADIRVLTKDGHLISLTVTVGLTTLDAKNIDEGINDCDKKMYQGKKLSKNVVVA